MRRLEELTEIMEKFAQSGWELIALPATRWLESGIADEALIAAIEQAECECGGCGCEFDPLYPRALELLHEKESA